MVGELSVIFASRERQQTALCGDALQVDIFLLFEEDGARFMSLKDDLFNKFP
jgi:hypothetical protein